MGENSVPKADSEREVVWTSNLKLAWNLLELAWNLLECMVCNAWTHPTAHPVWISLQWFKRQPHWRQFCLCRQARYRLYSGVRDATSTCAPRSARKTKSTQSSSAGSSARKGAKWTLLCCYRVCYAWGLFLEWIIFIKLTQWQTKLTDYRDTPSLK